MKIERIAEIKLRLNRGQGLFYELRNAVLIAAGVKVLLNLNIPQAILITIAFLFAFYFLGWLDLNKLKLRQAEAELSTSKYNPHLNKINKLLRKK